MGCRRELVFQGNVDSQEVNINWVLPPHTVQQNHEGHLLTHRDSNVAFSLHRYEKPSRDEAKGGLSSPAHTSALGPRDDLGHAEQQHGAGRYDRIHETHSLGCGTQRSGRTVPDRTDTSCPCSGCQILPYELKLLLQRTAILEVIPLPEGHRRTP